MSIDAIQLEEFRALRATIRDRAIARVILLAISWVGWAAIATAIMLVLPATPLLALPLVVVLAAFEVNLGTVRAAEGIADYLRVVFEERRAVPGWETASAALARGRPAAADPLFFWIFVAVLCANYLCVVVAVGETADPSARVREDSLDLAVATVLHAAVLLRFVLARRGLVNGRAGGLERLRTAIREERDGGSASDSSCPSR
jgi:hypothetical protein